MTLQITIFWYSPCLTHLINRYFDCSHWVIVESFIIVQYSMQRFLPASELQSQEYMDHNLKAMNYSKKLQSSQIENKHELSNLSFLKDRQAISFIVREEIKSALAHSFRDFEEEFKTIKGALEAERKNGQYTLQQLQLLKTNLVHNIENPAPKPSALLKRAPSTHANTPSDIKILHLQSQIHLISSKQQEFHKTNKCLNVDKLKEEIFHEVSVLHNQIKLEIANVRDSVLDIEEVSRLKCQKLEVENNDLFNTFQESIDDLIAKNRNNHDQMTRVLLEFEKYGVGVETNFSRIEAMEKALKEIYSDFEEKAETHRRTFDARLTETEELFQVSLQKIITPYNSNFQEVDRSISQLKQIVKDVLRFTKTLGDKLAVKLSNTVDAVTFQKTIENISESFNETYLLNTQKIRELNQKEYEVYHQLNQVKNVLEDLKVEYKSTNKLSGDGVSFDKRITSLGDLGIDSDEEGDFKQEETQEPGQSAGHQNPFKRKTLQNLEESFEY